jgi:hypothetical protein
MEVIDMLDDDYKIYLIFMKGRRKIHAFQQCISWLLLGDYLKKGSWTGLSCD